MKAGFIGAGKVGFTLGKYLAEGGITVTGYYSRTARSAREAAAFTGTRYYDKLADIVKDSERKINDAVTHKIIDLFVKGKLDLEEAAHECNLTVEDFIHAKEDYESSALA